MGDILGTFRQRAGELIQAINDRGGISAAIQSLRRQMAESDRRREIGKIRAELRRLDRQITEMITAVGVQAVGLHKTGHLHSPELQPLCEHIIELEAALATQKAELAALESALREATASGDRCPSCGQPTIEGGTFCPHCGAPIPAPEPERYCIRCGASLRSEAKFCARCGQPVAIPRK
ncbi:MAG: zinc-ribbon domain-containing protein [Chloroflexi bacterium]|nr:zinc-ribbon domain-containing protein [Chloroflexota bacterium]